MIKKEHMKTTNNQIKNKIGLLMGNNSTTELFLIINNPQIHKRSLQRRIRIYFK